MGPLNSSLFLASSQRTRFLGRGRKSGCLQNRPSLLSKVSVHSFRGPGLAKKSGSPGLTPSRGPGSDGGQGAVIPLNFQGPAAYLEARNTLGLERTMRSLLLAKEEGKRGVKPMEKQKPFSLLSSFPTSSGKSSWFC